MAFDLQTWIHERDEAACSFDIEKYKAFYAKYAKMGVYDIPLPSDKILEITLRKMVLAMANPPADKYAEACEWLTARGYSLEV